MRARMAGASRRSRSLTGPPSASQGGRAEAGAGDDEGGVLHGLLGQGFHLLELCGSGSAIVVTDDGFADLRGADVGAEIDGRALLFEAAEIAVESGPVHLQTVMVEHGLHWREGFVVLRRGGAAFA